MGHRNILDLYADYLITSTKYTTATTDLAKIVGNSFSHDEISQFLNNEEFDDKKLWSFINPELSLED